MARLFLKLVLERAVIVVIFVVALKSFVDSVVTVVAAGLYSLSLSASVVVVIRFLVSLGDSILLFAEGNHMLNSVGINVAMLTMLITPCWRNQVMHGIFDLCVSD